MMKMNRWLATAALAAAMGLGVGQAMAQQDNNKGNNDRGSGGGGRGGRFGGGNFDPAQMQQMIMENLRESLEVKDDAEWKALEPLVQKVMDTRRQVEGDRMRGMFGRRGRGGGGGGGGDTGGDQGGRRGGFFGQPSPEAEALTRAIEGKASNAELKAALAKFVEARKAKQAEHEKAQAELRKVLSLRQEAIATTSGLL
jgi:uncharacterized membrane protein